MGHGDNVQVWGEISFGQVGGFSTRQALDPEQSNPCPEPDNPRAPTQGVCQRLTGLSTAQTLSFPHRQFTHQALNRQGGTRAQPGTRFNWMKANPSIRELRKTLCWVPSSPTPSKEHSAGWCFDFIYTAWHQGAISLQGRVPAIQEGPFCPLSSSNLPFTHQFASFAYLINWSCYSFLCQALALVSGARAQ